MNALRQCSDFIKVNLKTLKQHQLAEKKVDFFPSSDINVLIMSHLI